MNDFICLHSFIQVEPSVCPIYFPCRRESAPRWSLEITERSKRAHEHAKKVALILLYSTLLSTLLYSTLSHFILNYLFSFLSLRQPYLHIHFGVFLSAALFVLLFFVFYQLFRFFCSQGASGPNSPRGSRNGTSQQCSPDCPGYVPCINNYQYHLYINHPCV